jgi:hypothetical protein
MPVNHRLVLVVCTLVLTAGCGGPPAVPDPVAPSGVSSPATSPTWATAAPTSDPSQSRLPSRETVKAALLAASELPGSYSVFPTDPANAPAAQLGGGVQGCTGESPSAEAQTTALAVHQGGPAGPFVAEAITASTWTGAVITMRGLSKVIGNCARFGDTLPGGIEVTVAIDQLTFPRVADEVVAFRLNQTMGAAGVAVYAHVVYVRTAGLVIATTLMQLSSPDVKDTERIVRAAVAKAERHLRG